MFEGKSRLKTDEIQFSSFDAFKLYIKERIVSFREYEIDKKDASIGYQLLQCELRTLKFILNKLENVITMHAIKEIKIVIEVKDTNGSQGSNDFKSLRELMSFLKMKEKIHIADALGYDPIKNKLK